MVTCEGDEDLRLPLQGNLTGLCIHVRQVRLAQSLNGSPPRLDGTL